MTGNDDIVEELKAIHKLLEPKPAPPAPPAPKGMIAEFKAFIMQYKVMGLAVAFILGLYLGALVSSLVKDLVMPLIGLAVPGLSDLASLTVTINNQIFGVGNFISAVIVFIVVALVIFLIVKIMKKAHVDF
jgi:large conductance mechanosensitive channel